MAKVYLTTTIPYVNADPHLGFAIEIIQADAWVRYRRLMGDEVFFNTGTDEHGQKIFQAAQKSGEDAQAYVDRFASVYLQLRDELNLSTDAFIRTTSPEHVAAAQEMWRRCKNSGDIYEKSYTGLYCVGCEMYKTEAELVDRKCTLHPTLTPETISEKNYFFRLSAYQEKLLTYLASPTCIVPEWRRKEAVDFVTGGLEDFSISRSKERLTWGVPVPEDDTQVMYVWFDAFVNYISTLGWPDDTKGNFKKFWEEGVVLQVAGKDMVRFQSIMWQAMLMSAGVKNTDSIFYHGFVNSEGQRMSKSLGNVIHPFDVVKKYGTDGARYLLSRHIHPVDDSDVSWAKFDEWYTANLANGLGNLVARVMKLAEDNLDGPIARPEAEGFPQEFTDAIERFEFNRAMDYIWGRIQALDQRINAEEPFKLVKTDKEAGKKLIAELVTELYWIGRYLNPFMPATNELIKSTILANQKPENLFKRLET